MDWRLSVGMGAGAPLVNQVTDHTDDAAKGLLADGDGDGEALILNNITPENILHWIPAIMEIG